MNDAKNKYINNYTVVRRTITMTRVTKMDCPVPCLDVLIWLTGPTYKFWEFVEYPNFFGVLYIRIVMFFLNKCVHFCLRFYPHVSGCDLSLFIMRPRQLEACLQSLLTIQYITYLSDTIVIGVTHQLCYPGATLYYMNHDTWCYLAIVMLITIEMII